MWRLRPLVYHFALKDKSKKMIQVHIYNSILWELFMKIAQSLEKRQLNDVIYIQIIPVLWKLNLRGVFRTLLI